MRLRQRRIIGVVRRLPRAERSVLIALCALGLLLLLFGEPFTGDDEPPSTAGGRLFQGPAIVHDGDTISIGDRRLRLFAIDAPEGDQICHRAGEPWRCGEESAAALRALLGSDTVECAEVEEDRFGRPVVRCTVGGTDVNDWMVRQGWAVAFRRYGLDYVDAEAEARRAGRGIWSSSFVPPEQWRAGRR